MKPSRYNCLSKLNDNEHLLFNTATGAFAALDANAYQAYVSLFDESGQQNAASEVSQQDAFAQTLLESLVNAGFAVESPADEAIMQQAFFQAAQQDRSTLYLCLAPTYACNLRCPYCYEKDHTDTWKMMDDEVIQEVYQFIDDVYKRDGFQTLNVQWYGGDPSLALDVVEKMSRHFIDWCANHQVTYEAMMLSNCARIGQAEAELLARSQVGKVMITIDGPEDLHNVRRPLAEGGNSYEALLQAVSSLQSQGIDTLAFMNVDKVNAAVYEEMRDQLEDLGVYLNPTKLNDYHQTYGSGKFTLPAFDLFTFPEYARWDFDRFSRTNPSADDIGRLLQPFGTFCRGQMESYYCIDALGDVYKCDGQMGQPEYRQFNLADDIDVSTLDTAVTDPALDTQCGACALLPVCRGNCHWERECCGMPCHPLKYTLPEYLALYRQRFDQPAEGFTLLVGPSAAKA